MQSSSFHKDDAVPLACVYHRELPMRVVTYEERDRLVASGEWFNNPNCEENRHEKPLRWNAGKRSSNRKCAPETPGS